MSPNFARVLALAIASTIIVPSACGARWVSDGRPAIEHTPTSENAGGEVEASIAIAAFKYGGDAPTGVKYPPMCVRGSGEEAPQAYPLGGESGVKVCPLVAIKDILRDGQQQYPPMSCKPATV